MSACHVLPVLALLTAILTAVVGGEIRQTKYRKNGEVEGTITDIQLGSGGPSSRVRCAEACTTAGCTGFSLSVREGGGQHCFLTTDPDNLPVGRWTTYTNPGK